MGFILWALIIWAKIHYAFKWALFCEHNNLDKWASISHPQPEKGLDFMDDSHWTQNS